MTVKLPPGTPLRETDQLVRELQAPHGDDEGIRTLYGVSGTGTRLDATATASAGNSGTPTVATAAGGSNALETAGTEKQPATLQTTPGATVDLPRPALFSCSAPLQNDLVRLDRRQTVNQ